MPLFKELDSVLSELKAYKSLLEERERTITALTAEVDRSKCTDAAKAEQLLTEHRDKKKLQQDLAAFASHTVDLRKRYGAQSKDIASIRNEFQTKVSLLEKDHIISSLTTEVKKLQRDLSASASTLVEPQAQGRYEAQFFDDGRGGDPRQGGS